MKNLDSRSVHPTPQAPRTDRYFIFVLLAFTAITYLNVLRFGFVYDDNGQIDENPFIKSWRYVPQYFASSVWKHVSPLATGNYYRPLFLVWLRLNYAVFNVRPLGWHVTVLLLHLLVTWLVYRVVIRMTGRSSAAWLTALIFGVHPIHHEVVAWICGSSESLFASFFMAAFLAYLRARESRRNLWMTVSSGLYALALLSKETAIVLPAVVFAHCWLNAGQPETSKLREYTERFGRAFASIAVYIPIGLLYLGWRFEVLGSFSHPVNDLSASTWLRTLPSILHFYLKHWFFPVNLGEFYNLFISVQTDMSHVIFPAALLLALAAAVWAVRGRLGVRDVGSALVWLLIPLLPALDIAIFPSGELVHDRYFYVPSLGAALLISLLIESIGANFGQPVRVMVAALTLALLLAFATARATRFWSDDYTLFTRANQIAPQNIVAQNNLSVEWLRLGQVDKADAMLEQAVSEHPDNWQATINLSRVHYMKKDYPAAEKLLRRAIELAPNAAEPYVTLGQLQLRSNRLDESLVSMRRAVELNPFDSRSRTIYGIVLEASGDCPAATMQFSASLELNRGDAFAQRELFRCRSDAHPESKSASQPAQR